MSWDAPRLIDLPKILDHRGNLSVIEEHKQIPFAIRRVYWLYDVPGGSIRGAHAFRTSEEVVVALSGSFDVVLHDGSAQRTIPLTRSHVGVYCPRMIWRNLENFSTNSVALILASTDFDDADYLRDFDQFVELRRAGDRTSR